MLESDFPNTDQALKNALDNLINAGEVLLSVYKQTLCNTLDSVINTATALGDSVTEVYIGELNVLLNKLELLPEGLLDEKILLPQKYSGFIAKEHSSGFRIIDLIGILITIVIGALTLAQNAAYHNVDSQIEQEYRKQQLHLLKEIAESSKGSTEQSELLLQELKEILHSAPKPD